MALENVARRVEDVLGYDHPKALQLATNIDSAKLALKSRRSSNSPEIDLVSLRLEPYPAFSTVGGIMFSPNLLQEPDTGTDDRLDMRDAALAHATAGQLLMQHEDSVYLRSVTVPLHLSATELEAHLQALWAPAEKISQTGAEAASAEIESQPEYIIARLREIITEMVQFGKPDHPLVLRTRDLYAYWLSRAERSQEAVHICRRLVEVRSELYGSEHGDVLASRHNLAQMIGLAGDTAAAVSMFEQIVEDRRRLLGERHRNTQLSVFSLAYWIALNGDLLKSVNMSRELYEDNDWYLGPNDEETLKSLALLAWALGLADDPASARDSYTELAERWASLNGRQDRNAIKYAELRDYWSNRSNQVDD